MKTFRFRFPRWHVAITILMVCAIAWAAYRTATKPTLHWLDALFAMLTLGLPLVALWREARQLGATLRIGPSGIECSHPDHPAQDWQIAADDIERVGTFESVFETRVVVIRKSGVHRSLSPAYWEASWAAARTRDGHAMNRALAEWFPVGEMGREETAKVLAPSMELGRVAARLTVAAAVMAVITIGVLFSIPLDMLGSGIPWAPIVVVFGGAAASAAWLVKRDPTAQLRVPLVPLLFGMVAAFLFTISAQKAIYLMGTPEYLTFRLEKTEGHFQIWRDVDGLYSPLEFPIVKGMHREPGTAMPIEVRTGPFGIRAISHDEIEAALGGG